MDVYSASDGYLVQIQRQLAEYDSLDQLTADVSKAANVDQPNVLLFLEDGLELREDAIQAAWERGGDGESSAGNTVLYLFNRETFWSDAETWAAQLQEEVHLPPQLNLSALSDLPQAQHPFIVAFDHLSHLQSLFAAQSRSLQIAYANLLHHLNPLLREYEAFAKRAEREIDIEEKLLRGSASDMAMLPKVVIHDAFLRRKDKERDRDGEAKTLADHVHPRKMEQVRETCKVAHDDHVRRYAIISEQIQELKDQSDAERRALDDRIGGVDRDFTEGLGRIELALQQIEALLSDGTGSAQDLMELDQAMREDLVALTALKNDFTLDVHIHLRQVADFQSRITQVVEPITTLDSDLRSKTAFPHLHRLKQLPFAYAASVVEVVRRKDFSKSLGEFANRFQASLDQFTRNETDRRIKIRDEILVSLPWQTAALEDSTNVAVRLTVSDGAEALAQINLGQSDLQDLLQRVGKLQKDEDITASVEKDGQNPADVLRGALETLISTATPVDAALEKMLNDTASLTRKPSSVDLKASQTLSAQLRSAERAKAEHAVKIADMEKDHLRQIKEMTNAHESLENTWQTQREELQGQLARVRSDLGEEMLARQALSAQLEETSKDQEDHADLVTGLQAELAQEKDRATDLGVRLQEALLDVDGLRNTEQTLSSQLHALQEDRKKSARLTSEAQQQNGELESQVAGLKAQLEATTAQLSEVQAERDVATKKQAEVAEKAIRDKLAGPDGDRAALDTQALSLQKQLEDLRINSEEKLSASRNSAVRHANGLQAELSLTRAQLREAQRKETILADELAMAKDAASAMTLQTTHQSDISRDAVALASRYYECCQRLLNSINASSTISGTTSTYVAPQHSSPPASSAASTMSKDHMRESILARSLATASNFDLILFAESVQKTISLVKKWSKSCKLYRDMARNKLSFTGFAKGDLALFLPTRNVAARTWAAFNVSAPHNFLKITDSMLPQVSTREWLIARIVKTEEAIASGGDSPDLNPFGLADGLRYYLHTVEEYDPTVARPSTRRSTSASFSASANGVSPTDRTRGPLRRSTTGGASEPIRSITPAKQRSAPLEDLIEPSPPSNDLSGPLARRDSSASDSVASPLGQSPIGDDVLASIATAVPVQNKKLSPVDEASSTLPFTGPAPLAMPNTRTTPAQVRTVSRTSSSPRDHPAAIFAPSSLGRPVSVASSSSSHPRQSSVLSGKAAPAMAVTSSNQGSSPGQRSSPLPAFYPGRKRSSGSLRPSSHDDMFKPSPLGSLPPLESLEDPFITQSHTTPFKALGTSSGPDTQTAEGRDGGKSPGGGIGSRLIRGFSGRRSISGAAAQDKPTALDMLRKLGDGSG